MLEYEYKHILALPFRERLAEYYRIFISQMISRCADGKAILELTAKLEKLLRQKKL